MARRTGMFPWSESETRQRVATAIKGYWEARGVQSERQKGAGVTDTGRRGEVSV